VICLGLIGCGEHAENGHAIPLARYRDAHRGEIELTAACDLDRQRAESFGRRYGFLKSYSDVDDMLSSDNLDGCIAVVPVEKITQVGIMLLRRGIPCVMEKPLGASLDQARELLDAARATGTPNMVSVNRRFMPFLNEALEWARAIGPLRFVRATMTRVARREPEFLWTTAVHAVDALRHIAGPVARAKKSRMDGDTKWYAIDLEFENGVTGRVDVLPSAGKLEETYELFGESFHAAVTCPFGDRRGWRGYHDGQLVREELAGEIPEDILNGCYDEASAFIGALKTGEPPHPSIEEVLPSVQFCFALAGI
jgi:predicted dehydrogenase